MTRFWYSLAWRLAIPLVLLRLAWRGLRERGYLHHWGERLGHYGPPGPGWHTIWVHAVSVGETRAAEPLIDQLLRDYPNSRVVLTHMTPTGRATGAALFARYGERLVQSYLPYDLESKMLHFIRVYTPRICILMETEVWPNLIAACGARRVPVALVNARLSARSLRRGQRLGTLMSEAARGIALVAAQTDADAARVAQLGAPHIAVTGSIKFDVLVPPAAVAAGARLRAQAGARPLLLCASTRDGEEAQILAAFARLAPRPAGMLLVIVPRHPQRFDEVVRLVEASGLRVQRRSTLAGDALDAAVLVGDSMGEMFAYFTACDVAFIGGSLLPLGGQNLIEACAVGKPVLVGRHTFNFAEATEQAIAAGAALCVADAEALMTQAVRLLGDGAARADMGARALGFAHQHRGATARTVELLKPLIY